MGGTLPLAVRIAVVNALEIFYTGLLVASALVITWFAFFVVYRLYRGQR